MQYRLGTSTVAFNERSRPVDKLTSDLAKKNHIHAKELAAKAKEVAECKAAPSLELK